jgi:uncharacterized iron-regulated membrane protein
LKFAYLFHRWSGWLLGPLLALSALGGCMLLWLQPLPPQNPQPPAASVLAAAIDAGLAELARARPDLRLNYIDLPRDAGQPLRVRLVPQAPEGMEAHWAELEATSGAVQDLRPDAADLRAWVFSLHHDLMLGDPGSAVLGSMALASLVSAWLALRVWWKVRRGRAPTLWRRWHRRIGVAALLPLTMMLLTGLVLSWPGVVRPTLAWLGGTQASEAPRVAALPKDAPPLPVGQALQAAAAVFPQAVPTRIYAARGGTLRVRLRSDEWHPNGLNNVYVHAGSGRVAKATAWRELPLSARYPNVIYPLHIGWLPGSPSIAAALAMRVLWTGLALSLAWLVLSGLPWRVRRGPVAAAAGRAARATG